MSRASDREAVVSALAGTYFPKVGDVGHLYYAGNSPSRYRTVRVGRVSHTGKTVWFNDGNRPAGRGVAWRRASNFTDWWAPVPRLATPGSPLVQLPARKP